ncbi:hypothetical protein HYT24_02440 [Candidatus Pacearchaeota archaeon]|nr:hypothetical protein [Candidatus Pacearchaeota archaeon]
MVKNKSGFEMGVFFEKEGMQLDPQRNYHIYGVVSVASEDEGKLESIAANLWVENDPEGYVDAVIITDKRKLDVNGRTVHYASAVGYIGN